MPYFEIMYEDVGFTEQDTQACELSEHFLSAYSETAISQRNFPEHVKAITKAYLSEDEGQKQDSEIKIFASVTLIVEAESEHAARRAGIPTHILTEIVDHVINEGGPAIEVHLENSWQITGVDDAIDFSNGMESRISSRKKKQGNK